MEPAARALSVRLAAIDCGTNTVLLTIAETDGDGELRPQPLLERAEITRLGEGLASTGRLSRDGIARTVQVFTDYATLIERAGARRVLAVGTEALRRADNGEEAVRALDATLQPLGTKLEIITGQREAQLSYDAVRASFPALEGARTVVDIGGGSTEIVVGDTVIEAAVSLPIGSVVLTEQHLPHDPPSERERAALRSAIEEALRAAPPLRGTVVGIAGTVTTYAAIALGLADYDATRVHGLRLGLAELERDVERLGAMRVDDRRRTPGLQPKRADVIYAGGVILSAILRRAEVDHCLVSDRGIRWGLLHEAAAGRHASR